MPLIHSFIIASSNLGLYRNPSTSIYHFLIDSFAETLLTL